MMLKQHNSRQNNEISKIFLILSCKKFMVQQEDKDKSMALNKDNNNRLGQVLIKLTEINDLHTSCFFKYFMRA